MSIDLLEYNHGQQQALTEPSKSVYDSSNRVFVDDAANKADQQHGLYQYNGIKTGSTIGKAGKYGQGHGQEHAVTN